MSAAHTPGPWVAQTGYAHGPVVTSPDGTFVADFTLWSDASDEAKANARLIAAAPDLMESICEVLPAVRAYLMSGDDMTRALKGRTWSPALRRAETAIRKATTAVEPNSVGTPQGVNQK